VRRRLGAGALCVVVGVTALGIAWAPAASASVVTPPPYATCTFYTGRTTEPSAQSSNTYTWKLRCQTFVATTQTTSPWIALRIHNTGNNDWVPLYTAANMSANGGYRVSVDASHNPANDASGQNNSTFTGALCVFYKGDGTQRACSVALDTAAGDYASAYYPTNYYAGGALGGPPTSVAIPTTTCSRTLAQNNGANVATFHDASSVLSATVTGSSWAFGDGATSAAQSAWPAPDVQHVYGAIASAPSGGWTAVESITATLASGNYQWADGSTGPKTLGCSLRVDFLNPDQATGGGSTTTAALDADCPTGWGWVNPLAIAKILKCLLIPSSSSLAGISAMWGTLTGKFPFSLAYDVATFLPATVGLVKAGFDYQNGTSPGGGYRVHCIDVFSGLEENSPLGPDPLSGGPGAGSPAQVTGVCPHLVDTLGATAGLGWEIAVVRDGVWLVVLVGFALSVFGIYSRVVSA
jgi:hypothetical protein